MEFINYSFYSPTKYKEFILKQGYKEIEKTWILEALSKGKKVLPYAESFNNEKEYFVEFIDNDFNIYTEFYDTKTGDLINVYKYKDLNRIGVILADNYLNGDPLNLNKK